MRRVALLAALALLFELAVFWFVAFHGSQPATLAPGCDAVEMRQTYYKVVLVAKHLDIQPKCYGT